jgi:hypothetical protein
MGEYIKINIEPNKIVAAHPWDKYTLFSLTGTDQNKKLDFVELSIPQNYSVSELQQLNADYVLLGFDLLSDFTSNWWMREKRDMFWDKPDGMALNTFAALASKEIFNYTLFASVKPWQAPGNNYLFAKVPSKPKEIKNQQEVVQFNFDSEEDLKLWNKITTQEESKDNLLYDPNEGLPSKSISISAKLPNAPFSRWISPPFKVDPRNLYLASAFIKSEKPTEVSEKDAFLRIDFYNTKPLVIDQNTIGDYVAISQRYYGNDWKPAELISPSFSTTWATISFQVTNPKKTNWIDNIRVYKIGSQNDYIPSQTHIYTPPENIVVPLTSGGH